jgi:hypothetical protein
MPDEDQLFLRTAIPPPALKRSTTDSDLEFVMGQIAKLRVVLFVGAVLGIVGIQAF